MALKAIYRRQVENSLASYDYVDVADGTGVIKFYAGGMRISGSTLYRLDRNVFASAYGSQTSATNRVDYNSTRKVVSDANYANQIDLDFDTSALNLPRILKGTMLCQIPLTMYGDPSDVGCIAYCVLNVYKVSATGTETLIATENSGLMTMDGGYGNSDKYFSFPVTIPTTNIKRGEKIRINVNIWAKDTGGSADPGIMLTYEPTNIAITAQDASGDNAKRCTRTAGFSNMLFYIPFRIDL